MIPRDTLLAILATHSPAARPTLAIPLNARELDRAIVKATADTGYAHGRDAANGNPWDYDASEDSHAIAEWANVAAAVNYRANYDHGYADGTAERNARRSYSDAEVESAIMQAFPGAKRVR